MAFAPKNWLDEPSTSTPIDRASLRDLEERLAEYAESLTSLTAWTALPLGSGWSYYGEEAVWSKPQYRKDGNGRVWLRGLIKHPTALGAGATIATLPAGFRPVSEVANIVLAGINGAAQGPLRVDVNSLGTLIFQENAASSCAFLSLDQIGFYTD